MPALLKDFALETLTSPNVDQLNFRFGPMLVYPSGYKHDIAGAVRTGRIRLTSDPSGIYDDPNAPRSGDAAYVIATPRGTVHPMFVEPRWTETSRVGLCIKQSLSPNELAYLRGTIIHEATHALQDYQRPVALDPPTAEASAYLAGAIAMRLWGYRTIGPIVNPYAGPQAYALALADRFLAERNPGRRLYLIPNADVAALKQLAPTAAAHRYVFNGI